MTTLADWVPATPSLRVSPPTTQRSWSLKWGKWNTQQIDDYMREVATWGPLTNEQACQLVQGIPPAPPGWDDPQTCLEGAASAVRRLRDALARGELRASPLPRELAEWCVENRVALPEPFWDALSWAEGVVPGQSAASTNSEAGACFDPAPSASVTARGKKAGRPPTAAKRNEVMCEEGSRFMSEQAQRSGRVPTLAQVSKHLQDQGLADHLALDSIKARIAGKLDRTRADAIAQAWRSERRTVGGP